MTTIYLSSTYEDLKDHRRVVFEALRQAGYQVIAMEDYVATDKRPVDKCLADVARSELYVGLFAFRYGYIPPAEHNNPDGLSITELELRNAERLEKPCLTFLVSEEASWPRKYDDGRSGKGEPINRLRDYLQTEKMASFFSSPHELAALVLAAVNKKLQDLEPSPAKETVASPAITWDIEEKGSPYPGLMHFTREYAPVFFGRDAEIRDILDLTHKASGRFIIVSGSSGTGKSSLVDAGVLPRLEQSGLPDDKSCQSVRMVPSQGNHPFDALMRVLHPYAERAGLDPFRLGEELNAQPATFTEKIQTIIESGIDRDALVLFVDQMEEQFTGLSTDKQQAQSDAFLTALYRGTNEAPLWVIATIRSDFLHFCHDRPEMLKVLRGPGHYPLGRVEPLMMDDMIVKPARCAGLSISNNLVQRLIRDTGAEPGNLPLLAFVLQRLFDERQGNTLSKDVYKEVRGVEGAIADHIKTVEAGLKQEFGSETLDRLPRIFTLLLQVGMEGPPTRRRALWGEFSDDLRPIVELLVNERLLISEAEGDESSVSLAHEALIRSWARLKDWLSENREFLLWQQRLHVAVADWERMKDEGALMRGIPLVEAERWMAKHDDAIEDREKAFIEASQELRNRDRRRALRRRIVAASLVAVVLSIVGIWFWREQLTIRHAWAMMLSTVGLYSPVEPEMIEITPDKYDLRFVMGSSEYSYTSPPHPVHIERTVAIGKYEVTFEEYDQFVYATGRTGSEYPSDQGWNRGQRPVINVSWEDAVAYAEWLSEETGRNYRLPSEAEWEYAARAGTTTEYWWGNDIREDGNVWANCNGCGSEWDSKQTAPVGSFDANPFGLHDTAGNVWEWVQDCWHDSYEAKGRPDDGKAWEPDKPADCGRRVIRGGSWDDVPQGLRSTFRSRYNPDYRNSYLGFRLAQD